MYQEQIDEIIAKHKMWLCWENGGKRADFTGCDLTKAVFKGVNLSGAIFKEANLSGATFDEAHFDEAIFDVAVFREAVISKTTFRRAVITRADFSEATFDEVHFDEAMFYCDNLTASDLNEANFSGAILKEVNFEHAILKTVNFKFTLLTDIDFAETSLSDVDMTGSQVINSGLGRADLKNVRELPPICCPDEGSFIGFKKASGYIVKLLIPADARRVSATTRKCRCDKAKVLEIQELDGTVSGIQSVQSSHDTDFIYTVGEMVSVSDFDENRFNECSTGIHFFLSRQDAVRY